MKKVMTSLEVKLAPVEKIFFVWLARVFAAATLVGSAWIDDAPPLEIVALLVAVYVSARIASQFGALSSASPFHNRALSGFFAFFMIVLLAGAFIIVVIFVNSIALTVVG